MKLIRRLLFLAVVFAIGNAGWHAGVVWFHYQAFKDGVHEAALFGTSKSDDALKDQVMDLAARNNVPLDRDYVDINRGGGQITISAQYAELVPLLPWYKRRFDFDVNSTR